MAPVLQHALSLAPGAHGQALQPDVVRAGTHTIRTRAEASSSRMRPPLGSITRPTTVPGIPAPSHVSLLPARAARGVIGPPAALHAHALPVALLFPGISMVVVAANLPEAGLVLRNEFETAQPLGALVEVELRHYQTHRATVLRLQI